MNHPPSPALAAIGPEIASARPASLPGDLLAAADVLASIAVRITEAEQREELTRVKRQLLAKQRERLTLLADAARSLVERDRPVQDAIVRYLTLDEPLASASLERRERMARVVETGLPDARQTLQRLAHGDHVHNIHERALDLRELASLYGRFGTSLEAVPGYALQDEPAAFREARAILGFVMREMREAERLRDHAGLWTLIEHGHAAAVAALVYAHGDEAVEVTPL